MSYCKKFLPYSRDNVPFVIFKERIENISGNECLIKRACLAPSASKILDRSPYEEDLFNTYGISCNSIDEESIVEIYENCPLIDRNILIVTEQEEIGVKTGVLLANMELYPDVIVIFALYDNELQGFLGLDKGLESRIRKTIHFKDYSVNELVSIFEEKLSKNGYDMEENLSDKLEIIFENEIKSENFANARTARKLVEEAITQFSIRTFEEENPERVIILEDILK